MNGLEEVSHVASPRECDARQLDQQTATNGATVDATTRHGRPSIRDLARDTLVRHGRDKEAERRATALRQSIERCCDARGDDDENRAALIRECGELLPDAQLDMLEHFQGEAIRFGARRGDFG